MSTRPFQVGDRVRIAEHLAPHFFGATHGTVDQLPVGTKFQDVQVDIGHGVYWFAATDLTLDPGAGFTDGQPVRALTGRHSGKVGTVTGKPTSDGWCLVTFQLDDGQRVGRYPSHELEPVEPLPELPQRVRGATLTASYVDADEREQASADDVPDGGATWWECPRSGCDTVIGEAGPVDPDDDYDPVREHVEGHERDDEGHEVSAPDPWPTREVTTIVTADGTAHRFETERGKCLTCEKSPTAHPITIRGERATILAVFPGSLRVRYSGIPDMLTVPLDEPDGSVLCHDDVPSLCSCRGGEVTK